jgi:hypothetical protein
VDLVFVRWPVRLHECNDLRGRRLRVHLHALMRVCFDARVLPPVNPWKRNPWVRCVMAYTFMNNVLHACM